MQVPDPRRSRRPSKPNYNLHRVHAPGRPEPTRKRRVIQRLLAALRRV